MIETAVHKTPWFQATASQDVPPLFYVDEGGRLRIRAHTGQQKALDSTARYILVVAGLQSGKTVAGPWWMLREMALCGPGDYLAAGPTFPLLMMKCLPEYEALFERRLGWGRLYKGYPPVLEMNGMGRQAVFGSTDNSETRIIFGAGIKPESLESATVKAAHLDEAGQKQFLRASHEAVQGRLSIHRGRILYTTTPYGLGWLKGEVYDRAKKDQEKPPYEREYELIQFASTMNPAFSQAEFDDMRQKLPAWKFNMRYRGQFERPAGMIYDCFSRDKHCIPRFAIPDEWPRHLGLDFGGVNTAGVFLANEPETNRYVLYRSYHAGERTAKQHVEHLTKGEPQPRAAGGAKSEGQWRSEFRSGGLSVKEPPVSEVEVGIDRVYAMLKARADGNLKSPYLEIFDDLGDVLDEIESYSRKLDDNDEPTEKIADKETFHLLDALRYIASDILQPSTPRRARTVSF